ncbi:MAG TPA: aminotransferase class I/II-fold pyridoxal phosphate-dependent enzyme [Ruminiclostridium sp.]|nr:aminotransferase class I/II-fold pyridoxal phosphate-dependent enzyme [Ruminiclostridium sp.]
MQEYSSNIQNLERSEKSLENLFQIVINNDSIACEFVENGKTVKWTYNDYKHKIIKAASVLSKKCAGIDMDSYIALKLPNSPLWPVMFWSILMSGYKPLLLDASMDDEMTAYLMKQAGAKMLINSYFAFDDEDTGQFVPHWSNEYALCTSGTTSSGKVYYYTGEALCYQLLGTRHIGDVNKILLPHKTDKVLVFLPFHHIFGFSTYIWFSFAGAASVYIKDRSPETVLEACRSHGITHIMTVPLLPNNITRSLNKKLKQASASKQVLFNVMAGISLFFQRISLTSGNRIAKKMFGSLLGNLMGSQIKVLICGGSHLSKDTLKTMNAIGYYTICGFGMTEIGMASSERGSSMGNRLSGSVGQPYEYVDFKVEGGNGFGTLYIKGKAIHSGRLVDGKHIPPDTNEDGWFNTEDIARYRKGSYWIEGRIKDVIINESGENVYPDELEDYFLELPVRQMCVLGIKKDDYYEYISLVMSTSGTDINGETYGKILNEINRVNGTLPVMKKINKAYLTSEPLPVANGIKVKRNTLKELIEGNKITLAELDLNTGSSAVVSNANTAGKADLPANEAYTNELDSIKKEVRKAFGEVLDIPAEEIGDAARFIEDLGGDSLSSISLLKKVEEKYNISIPDSEYYGCTNVQTLSNLVLRKTCGLQAYDEVAATATAECATVNIITSFEESPEYKEFLIRQKNAKESGNPYFICHDSIVRDVSMWNGVREILNFGSYNYVGMSGHPDTIRAAKDAADKYGTSASGSRILAGEKHLYQELEKKIALWKNAEDAIVMVSGHATNVTFVGNFCNKNDIILYDSLSHNSIVQGCQLSKSDSKAFPHNDFETLENILKRVRSQYEKILVVVEGVYSMDGDIAPIPEFIKLKQKYGFFLMVDEAHSACVIGEHGGGVDDYFKLGPSDVDIKMGTLSKGLGTCGGYIAGRKALIEYLRYNVPGFVFSVGINPPSAAAALKAVEILLSDNTIVKRLQANIKTFLSEAHKRRLDTCLAGETAIIPIMVGKETEAFTLSNIMLQKGVFVPPAVYPAVPKEQARLRFCVCSEHKPEQIVKALDLLVETAAENNINILK